MAKSPIVGDVATARPRKASLLPPQKPPAQPLIGDTGSAKLNAVADVINTTASPFQNAPDPAKGTLGEIEHGIGAVMLAGSVSVLIGGVPAAATSARPLRSGLFDLRPDGSGLLHAYCDMANGGWTLIAVVRLRAGEGHKRYTSVSSTNTNAIDALADGGN